MSKRWQADWQWDLFERPIVWHGFSEEIREQVIHLFATMGVEIVDQPRPESKEQSDERTAD